VAADRLTCVVSVRDLPEVMFEVRRELAQLLRGVAAEGNDPVLGHKLDELAALFETGQRREL
jgi:hypothetical protein